MDPVTTKNYPRWEVRPTEPGGLAWVTDPDDDLDNGFDIEELFCFLAWRGDPECQRAVRALVEIVKKRNQPLGPINQADKETL